MKVSRRDFLKLSGVAMLGVAAKPALNFISDLKTAQNQLVSIPPLSHRWGMVVDLTACLAKDGCRDCIDACHSIHNVPDFGNPKDEVKWIWTVPYPRVFEEQEHEYIDPVIKERPALLLCNHCDNPPCVKVCPTQATYRRDDGVVMQDYHRCIGCRYCMAACPYGSRSFNWKDPAPFIKNLDPGFPKRTIGVVEKCNLCEERLAKDLLPACVETCKGKKALIFGDLNDPKSEIRKILVSRHSLRRKPELGTKPEVYYIL